MPLISIVASEDERPHVPSERQDWRESYYFNFVDLTSGISGFTTIGLLPNLKKREFVFALFHDDKRETYFIEPEGAIPEDPARSLSDGHLSFELIEPLKEWRIRFAGEDLTADIRWTARFPAYHFAGGSGTSWSGHFEQSGHVNGVVKLPGGDRVVRGLGQRDKSWGHRDWHIESWYALHAQFNSFSIGLRRDIVNGIAHVSGDITSADRHVIISKVDLETEYADAPPGMPVRATTRVYGADESHYTLRSSLISPSSFVRFSRPFPGGTTELYEKMATHECEEFKERGTGLMEWLFTHPNK